MTTKSWDKPNNDANVTYEHQSVYEPPLFEIDPKH